MKWKKNSKLPGIATIVLAVILILAKVYLFGGDEGGRTDGGAGANRAETQEEMMSGAESVALADGRGTGGGKEEGQSADIEESVGGGKEESQSASAGVNTDAEGSTSGGKEEGQSAGSGKEEGQSAGTEESAGTQKEEAPAQTEQPQQADLKFRTKKLLNQHYEKHGIEMGFASAEEYQAAAAAVVNNPEALHKLEKEDGDDVYYVESTNEFVIVSKDGYLRTYFLPSAGIKYYNRQ